MLVITTPTGDIGTQLVADLLARGKQLRLIARDPAKLDASIRDRVEVIEGSHRDAAVVDKAFAGAEAVFWLVPPDPKVSSLEAAYLDFTRPAVAAIQKHRVPRIVSVSALGRGTPDEKQAGLVTAALAMDDLLATSGAHLRALANPSFFENLLRQTTSIREKGMFFGPIDADRKAPTCSTRDIAATAAQLLSDLTWTGVEEAAVLGPEDLSFNEMATIMSQVLGKPIKYQQITLEQLANQLSANLSPAFVQGYVDMMRAKNRGLDNGVKRTAGNTTPTSFRAWCETVLKPAVAMM